ncbi:hypothetical protein BU14_0647s0010 [Porphyra umbilicalis]|uniref:Uncharacterized protein n=1 Tax=Porphyra umbilicalis TaxID=2786 RepID=A0A1X6NQI5_PORUM|nr:hypothetical protein BU14_0647s0010 [Porphyra umbilicalis]|eukprot:OSX70871.1 hypothetical protein BU14_0647s0010 [Porphyra umbilicalis]
MAARPPPLFVPPLPLCAAGAGGGAAATSPRAAAARRAGGRRRRGGRPPPPPPRERDGAAAPARGGGGAPPPSDGGGGGGDGARGGAGAALWDAGWSRSAAHWPSPARAGLPGAAPAAGVRPPITDALLRAMVDGDTPDAWVNDILWALLGYRRTPSGGGGGGDDDGNDNGGGGGGGGWDTSAVADAMVAAGYGDAPPDFIGSATATSAAVDRPVKKAVQALNRSVPPAGKQLLKSRLGFGGWRVGEMTPNKTRRATAVNWILWWLDQHGLDEGWGGGGGTRRGGGAPRGGVGGGGGPPGRAGCGSTRTSVVEKAARVSKALPAACPL